MKKITFVALAALTITACSSGIGITKRRRYTL